jgi:hypothetical protein
MPERFHFYNEFCNYFAAMPGLLNRATSIIIEDAESTLPLPVLTDAYILRANLKHWYDQFITSFNGHIPPFVEVQSITSGNMFPLVYFYDNTLTACLLCTYYAYLIVLNTHIDLLLSDEQHCIENTILARKICMSVEYCLEAGICGAQSLTFALPYALSACEEELRDWIKASINKIGGFMEIAKCLDVSGQKNRSDL